MRDLSPALQTLKNSLYEVWDFMERRLIPEKSVSPNELSLWKAQGDAVLQRLNDMVNESAKMSPAQAVLISMEISERMVKQRDIPNLHQLLPIATYINSCS